MRPRRSTANRGLCQLASDVEHLRTQYQGFAARLPKQSDSKEWVQYLLDGIRRFPLRLTGLDCDPVRDVGPYKAAVLRVELEGTFSTWTPCSAGWNRIPGLLRIDSVRISPSHGSGTSSSCGLPYWE